MKNYEFTLTDRLLNLREEYLKVKPSIAINRALAHTEIAKECAGDAVNVRRAKGFKRACETAPLLIQPGELIVGHPCGRPRAGSFSPDVAWQWVRDELGGIDTRAQDPYIITDAEKKAMVEQLFPFWQGKSLAEECEKQLREAGYWEYVAEAAITDVTYHVASGGGDSSPGYDNIIFKKGINGVLDEARQQLATPDIDDEKRNFYTASVLICEGVLIYCNRLSEYAAKLAEGEQNPKRREELLQIAAVNKNVPANPPANLWEALQAVWTIHSLFLLEENQSSTSLGRVDQYMLDCYSAGGTTPEQAFELIGCFMIKCSEFIWYTPTQTARYFAGYIPYINLTVGGQKPDGSDGTNELTYIFMEAVRQIKLYQPTLTTRIHSASPDEYLDKVMDVVAVGGGMPACHFDDAHIKMMQGKGYSLEDARDYSIMGCVEPQKSGSIHQWTAGGFTQWPICIELALNNGVLKSYGDKSWLETGDIEDFTEYEQFEGAVLRQLDNLIDINCKATVIIQKVFRDVNPTPYMSILIDGCMQSGRDVTAGGATLYSGPGTIFAGLATYADSMAAVKKLVYEDKKYSLKEIKAALDANFVGYEKIKKDCLNVPKYGNDNAYVDEIAKDIINYTEKKINGYDSLYSKQIHGTLSQSANTPLGAMLSATPDGRLAAMPLSDAISPSHGADKNGPTAIIKSVSRLDVENMSLGMAHNFKFSKGFLANKAGKDSVVVLLKTASLLGNGQMQFNCVDNETLLKAKKNPEKYRDLIVRVAGYCAFFTELCEDVQNEIIERASIQ